MRIELGTGRRAEKFQMHHTVVFAQCGDMGQMTGYGNVNRYIIQLLAVKRWVVERSFAWLEKCRRLWKTCERDVNTSPQFIHLAFLVRLLFCFAQIMNKFQGSMLLVDVHGLASSTRLNGVCAARRKRLNPP